MDIPKDKNYPPGAGQCNECGGWGCEICQDKGWLPAGHHRIRKCANTACGHPLLPNQVAVYCSNQCAMEDAKG